MAGPITNAINAQFDAWDAQIDDLKNKSKEAAREQVEKIKKDIQEYVDKKKAELDSQKAKTDAEKSAFAVPDVPKKVDDILSWATKVKNILAEMMTLITSVVTDLATAPVTLTSRAAQSLSKLTQV